METNVEKILNDFVGTSETIEELEEKNVGTAKNFILDERKDLIERINKQYVTSDGRMLLREQY